MRTSLLPLLLLVAAALAGTSALRNRQRLLEAIDRRFFREQYDSRRLLTLLVEHLRSTRDLREMEDLIANGIDRALHLESIALLIDDPDRGQLVDPDGRTRSLDGSSALAMMVAGHRDPLEVDIEAPRSPLRRLLPEPDRHWLVDGRFRLLVPLIATDGSLIGMIALGGKKSELPFLAEDRELLAAVASAATLARGRRRAHRTPPPTRPTPPEGAPPGAAAGAGGA
jgi:sigma-B regulation protein RsbU (phosphoserine phosphatase)